MSAVPLNPTRTTATARWGSVVVRAVLALLLGLGVVVVAFPFAWMIGSAFKPGYELFPFPAHILPQKWTLESYAKLFASVPFWRYYANSACVTVSYTALALFFSSQAGFAFANYRFRGRTLLFAAVMSTLMIPIYAMIIPLYVLMAKIGWMDTYRAVILPFAAPGIIIFFMRQSMLSIPDELLDAGRVDGCTEFGLYWRIALPMSRPALVVCTILLFTSAWNDFLWPLVVLRSSINFTIPIALANFVGLYEVDYASIMAGSVLATLPVPILFVALQRFFLAGLLAGALKQ